MRRTGTQTDLFGGKLTAIRRLCGIPRGHRQLSFGYPLPNRAYHSTAYPDVPASPRICQIDPFGMPTIDCQSANLSLNRILNT